MMIPKQIQGMNREEVRDKIAAAGIRDYGVYRTALTDLWEEAARIGREENLPMKVVVGLNNGDTHGVLLQILKESPERVMDGMAITAYAVGAEEMILHIPEYAEELRETLQEKAYEYGILLVSGLINQRMYQGCVLNHIATMANVADCMADSLGHGIYVSVNGESLKRVKEETKISDLLTVDNIKAYELGYRIYGPEAADMTVAEAEITNGVVCALTEKQCIVQETEKRLLKYRGQSCGRCVFCREGLLQLQSMAKDIAEGKGKQEYLDYTTEIGSAMTFSTSCSLGQKSSEIILGALDGFKGEFDLHIKKKKCPAELCFSKTVIYIDPKTCAGCGDCMDVCPADCIEGKLGYIHMIDPLDCTKCGKCIEACEEDAVIKTDGKLPKLPNRLTKCGKFKRR